MPHRVFAYGSGLDVRREVMGGSGPGGTSPFDTSASILSFISMPGTRLVLRNGIATVGQHVWVPRKEKWKEIVSYLSRPNR